jgi:hypothetical protein
MRLFVSYSHVDREKCEQIVNELRDDHEIWYDRRLLSGQAWWDEIQRNLRWCDGCVFLISPESVASEYCRKEIELATTLHKRIFPVLIRSRTVIPGWLSHLQYLDLSENMSRLHKLVTAIFRAEQEIVQRSIVETPTDTLRSKQPFSIRDVVVLMEKRDYAGVLTLIQTVPADQNRAISAGALERLRQKAAQGLEAEKIQTRFDMLAEMIKSPATRDIGCEELAEFRQSYVDFLIPDDIIALCAGNVPSPEPVALSEPLPPAPAVEVIRNVSPPPPAAPAIVIPRLAIPADPVALAILPAPFEWILIPEGTLAPQAGGERVTVPPFAIAKYPITNAQFQAFVDASDGYADTQWWDFSPEARHWRELEVNAQPQKSEFAGDDYARTNVSWFEAVAFCRWLSARLGDEVSLSSDEQWQRAARGDNSSRYPWGDKFDAARCNSSVAATSTGVTPVTAFPNGASPFGVLDMSGNVWEWCLTEAGAESVGQSSQLRVMHGGCWRDDYEGYLRIGYRDQVYPRVRDRIIGFRCVCV